MSARALSDDDPANTGSTEEPANQSAAESFADDPEPSALPGDKESRFKLHIPTGFWIISGIMVSLGAIAGVIVFLKIRIEKREERERAERYQRRQKRLQDIGISSAEFDLLMQQKRNKNKKE